MGHFALFFAMILQHPILQTFLVLAAGPLEPGKRPVRPKLLCAGGPLKGAHCAVVIEGCPLPLKGAHCGVPSPFCLSRCISVSDLFLMFMSFRVSFWSLSASVCVCPSLFLLFLLDDPFCVFFSSVRLAHVVPVILFGVVLNSLCVRSFVSFCSVFRDSQPSLRDHHVRRPCFLFPWLSGCAKKSLGGDSTRTMNSTEPPAEGRVGLIRSADLGISDTGEGAETDVGAWRRIVGCPAV